jgi:hypothetical protein
VKNSEICSHVYTGNAIVTSKRQNKYLKQIEWSPTGASGGKLKKLAAVLVHEAAADESNQCHISEARLGYESELLLPLAKWECPSIVETPCPPHF